MIRNIMALCDKSGQFLFQVVPDLFPHGRVTHEEMMLWDKYYADKKNRQKARQ